VRRIRVLLPLVVLGLLFGLPACRGRQTLPRTQLMVVAGAEPALQSVIKRLRIRVWGRAANAEEWEPNSLDQEYARVEWPFRVGIVPLHDDATRRVKVEAIAIGAAGEELIVLRAVTGFLEGRTLALPLFFEQLCVRRQCEEEESTCQAGECVSAVVDPGELSDLDEYDLSVDAGSPKPDAGSPKPDAGSPKPDAGSPRPDAGSARPELDASDTMDAAASSEGGSASPDSAAADGAASDAGSEAGPDAASDSGVDDPNTLPSLCGSAEADATPGEDCRQVVTCGEIGPCDLARYRCCLGVFGPDDTCSAAPSCGTEDAIFCDGREDCANGQTCCFEGGQSSCQGTCATGYTMCHVDAECPPGKVCTAGYAQDFGPKAYPEWGFCGDPEP
jgi:hypothetical protein